MDDWREKIYEQMKIQNMLLCNIYVVLATQNQKKYFTGDDSIEKFYNVVKTIGEKCCDVLVKEDLEEYWI